MVAQVLMGIVVAAVVSIQVYVLLKVTEVSERIAGGRAERIAIGNKHDAEIRDLKDEVKLLKEENQRKRP